MKLPSTVSVEHIQSWIVVVKCVVLSGWTEKCIFGIGESCVPFFANKFEEKVFFIRKEVAQKMAQDIKRENLEIRNAIRYLTLLIKEVLSVVLCDSMAIILRGGDFVVDDSKVMLW